MRSLKQNLFVLRQYIPKRILPYMKMAKAVSHKAVLSPSIPPALLSECRVCASRFDLIDLLPKEGRIAEVGTQNGDFAYHMLEKARPTELHVIDLYFGKTRKDLLEHKLVFVHQGLSNDELARFDDDYFDWIYIDADHSYQGVASDAAIACTKVKPGGFLIFNDFAHVDPFFGVYGVHRAVVEFAVRHQWPFKWLAYETSALYDVALQRPLL